MFPYRILGSMYLEVQLPFLGDMSWVLRIQNETNYQNLSHELPLPDVTTLFLSGNKCNLLDQPNASPQHQQQTLQLPVSPLEVRAESKS